MFWKVTVAAEDKRAANGYGEQQQGLRRQTGKKSACAAKKSAIALAFAACFDYVSALFDGEHS